MKHMSQRENERLVEAADREPINTELNMEMMRVQYEAQDNNVVVNGCQRGIQDIPDFTVATDMTTGATFAVKIGEPLVDALDKAQTRMTKNHIDEAQSGEDR